MLARTALGGIWVYQNYLSPRKGFRCAHSVLHGGTGCSGYVKFAIRDHGLWAAVPKIRQRFRDCKEAHQTLRANCAVHSDAPDDEHVRKDRERRKRANRNGKSGRCSENACECATLPGYCGSASRAAPKKGLDINPCDGDIGIGGCDCASCDAGGCDCGGCSCS